MEKLEKRTNHQKVKCALCPSEVEEHEIIYVGEGLGVCPTCAEIISEDIEAEMAKKEEDEFFA